MRNDGLNTHEIAVRCRSGISEDVAGVENIEPLVLHRAHVEVARHHNVVVVQVTAESEALFIQRRLEANAGNVKRTAEELGMQRSHLYKKLDRYGLRG